MSVCENRPERCRTGFNRFICFNRFTWPAVALFVCAGFALMSCGDDEEDPVDLRCTEACQVDQASPCAGQQQHCLNRCRGEAGPLAKTGFKRNECGVCVAGLYAYSGRYCKTPTERCDFGTDAESCESVANCGAAKDDVKCFGVFPLRAPEIKSGSECESVCIDPEA